MHARAPAGGKAPGGAAAAASLCLLLAGAPAGGAGDPARGEALAPNCAACHGPTGVSPSPAFPILAGQHEEYLLQALLAYQSGSRQESIMGGAVRTLSRQDLEDLAAYFARQQGLAARAPVEPAAPPAPAAGRPPGPDPAALAAVHRELLARALPRTGDDGGASERAGCPRPGAGAGDRDGDGLPDAYDAAPADAGEFVADADGDGYYGICNARQLQAIQTLGTGEGERTTLSEPARLARRYELVSDLDLGEIGNFQPIGTCGPQNNCMIVRDQFAFAGQFDGHGHTLQNLRIERPETGGVGLFGTLARGATVWNLRLADAEVTGLHGVGTLVGANFGLLADCAASGSVRGRLATGGLVGGNAGRVSACTATVSVAARDAVGGLVGDMNGIVDRSRAEARISANKGVGGLVGLNTFGQVLDSEAVGHIEAADNVGGLVGVNTDALVADSRAAAQVRATGTNVGGLVGFNSPSRIEGSSATGSVSGRAAVGGLVGRNNGSIRGARAEGEVRGETLFGPLVGDNTGGSLAENDAPTAGRERSGE